jgi:tetratricopeptide (TPR) repeat protein
MIYPPIKVSNCRGLFFAALLIAVCVLITFGRTVEFDFVNYDDDVFVYRNPLVANGLSGSAVMDVLTRFDRVYYYPFTLISLMTDASLYGLNPFGFHLTNVLLHLVTAVLLLLALRSLTGSIWRSTLVVLLFALHPLRVESVAWITERKDVLSGVFFMLGLWAYSGYARHPFSWRRYLAVVLCFAAGLMSKPMLVTFPFVLLLLDWWPLERLSDLKACLLEKVPLFLLAVLFSVVTLNSSAPNDAAAPEGISLLWRTGNALVSYVAYIRQMIVPGGLMVPYPAEDVTAWGAGLSLAVLAVCSVAVYILRRKSPYLLTGWLWYLGMLVPVTGIVRILGGVRADRFTYFPHIGLCIGVVWLAAERGRSRPVRIALSLAGAVAVAGLMVCSRAQCEVWRDSEALWTHSLSVCPDNPVAHGNLGSALFITGDTDRAIVHFQRAIALGIERAEVFNNLGVALAGLGRYQEAIEQYRKALALDEGRVEIIKHLAEAMMECGDAARAAALYETILNQDPNDIEALAGLATARLQAGKRSEALEMPPAAPVPRRPGRETGLLWKKSGS